MLDLFGIGTIQEFFQLEGTKQERLKNLVNTVTFQHPIPFGPLDLVVSSESKKSNTSSHHRSSSGHPVESIVVVISGGSTEFKQWWKNEFRSSAFLLSEMVSSLHKRNRGWYNVIIVNSGIIRNVSV